MIQEVNLYRGVLRPQRTLLSTRQIAAAMVATLVVLGGIYALLAWRLDQRQEELATLQTESDRVSERLESLQDQVAGQQADPALTQRADELEQELRLKRGLVGLLSGEARGNITGFSGLVAPLARRHMDGLWLDEIVFRQGGDELALRGRTLDPANVPAYLKALREESAYRGRQFGSLRIQRVPEQRGLSFVIATRCPGVGDEARVQRAAACLQGTD